MNRPMRFLGGPLHGEIRELPETMTELIVRHGADKTFSHTGRDRYTRRRFVRIDAALIPHEAFIFAHETWWDDEIANTHLAEDAWRPIVF